jgi:hypothetical protein
MAAEARGLTFDADVEGKITSKGGWKRRYGRLELWRFDNDYWSRPGGNPHKAALYKDKWDAEHAVFDAKQRTSETAVYGYGAGGAPARRAVAPLVGLVEDLVREVVDAAAAPMPLPAVLEHYNPAEWERCLDYFWDFHGPNPNPTTGYKADY